MILQRWSEGLPGSSVHCTYNHWVLCARE
jgi:hypothetical protein